VGPLLAKFSKGSSTRLGKNKADSSFDTGLPSAHAKNRITPNLCRTTPHHSLKSGGLQSGCKSNGWKDRGTLILWDGRNWGDQRRKYNRKKKPEKPSVGMGGREKKTGTMGNCERRDRRWTGDLRHTIFESGPSAETDSEGVFRGDRKGLQRKGSAGRFSKKTSPRAL